MIKTAEEILEYTTRLYDRKELGDKVVSVDWDLLIQTVVRSMKDYAEQFKSKWIPVSESLPLKDGNSSIMCLVVSTYDGIVCRPYNEYHECWDGEDYDDHYTEAVGGKITHWMPLPTPPQP